MSLVVREIRFHHRPEAPHSSALAIRRNATQPARLPEWSADGAGDAAGSPAAYAIERIRGNPLSVWARFRRLDSRLESVEVRAIQPLDQGGPPQGTGVDPQWISGLAALMGWAPESLWLLVNAAQWQAAAQARTEAALNATGNVLGEVAPMRVTFRSDGTTPWVKLGLQNVRLASRGVGAERIAWLWQYRGTPAESWKPIGRTEHTIYSLLDVPTLPWVQEPETPGNTQLPWAEAMEVACRWAAGALTREAAAQRITAKLNSLGQTLLQYGCPLAGAEMYSSSLLNCFDCTAFLDRLKGGMGNGAFVNCSDCAAIVSTFANLLGCDLWQSRMGQYVPAFRVNPVIPLSSRTWGLPCGQWPGFNYHEVAWSGQAGEGDCVYDASLQVDGWSSPQLWPRWPLLPANMRFGRPGEGQYRDRLAVPSDAALCAPRPQERRRRAVC